MNLIYDGNNMRLYDAKGSIRAASNSFITANGYTYDGMRQPRNPAYDSWIWIFDTTPTFTTAPGPAGLKIRTLNCAYNASDRITTFSATCAIGEFPRTSSYYRAEQYDSDLGLYYLRARYYNPLTGRFMSRDPEDGKAKAPKTLHKYLYAAGDPVDGSDPTGRDDIMEFVGGLADKLDFYNSKNSASSFGLCQSYVYTGIGKLIDASLDKSPYEEAFAVYLEKIELNCIQDLVRGFTTPIPDSPYWSPSAD